MRSLRLWLLFLAIPCVVQAAGPVPVQDDIVAEIKKLIEAGEFDGLEEKIYDAQRKDRQGQALNRTRLLLAQAMAKANDHYGAADAYSRYFRNTVTRPAEIKRHMDKALTELEKAIEDEKADWKPLMLRRSFAQAFARTRDYKSAADQYEKLLTAQLEKKDTAGAALMTSLMSVQTYFSLARRTGDVLPLAERVDERVSAKMDAIRDKVVAFRVHSIKATAMKSTDPKAAEALLKEDYELSKKLFEEDKDNNEAASLHAWSLNHLYLLQPTGDDASMYFNSHQELAKQLATKKRNYDMLRNYMSAATRNISMNYRNDPKSADTVLQTTKSDIDDLYEAHTEYKAMLSGYERSLASYERRIASALKIVEMIGTPAPELDAAAWVTQDGDNPVDLKGKVVLLDFWAVWCGPCIRTFPHLKHLEETYGKDGLQIVGVTRYYNYKWNEDKEKAERGKEEDADLEHVALRKFLASHKLKHPTIVVPTGSQMQQEFGVSGIPHAVVIDREGVIQLVKVGSGQANADAIEAKIKELLK